VAHKGEAPSERSESPKAARGAREKPSPGALPTGSGIRSRYGWNIGGHVIIRGVFTLYATLYLRVSQAFARRRELEADAAAVAVSGRRPMGDALRKVRASAAAWDFYLASYCGLIGPARGRPDDLFAGFLAMLREPSRHAELARLQGEPEKRSPYDSHPSLAERLAAIDRLPEPHVQPDTRPALALLADPRRAALSNTRAIARAFEGLLIQAGRARYVFSWAEATRLTGDDGAPIDLTEPVGAAVADPHQVNALHQGLLRLGLTPASAPVEDFGS
jgi:hypothetical protein